MMCILELIKILKSKKKQYLFRSVEKTKAFDDIIIKKSE